MNSHIERHIERGIQTNLNKQNSKEIWVSDSLGELHLKFLFHIHATQVSNPHGELRLLGNSFLFQFLSWFYYFPLGKACRVARVKYKYWMFSGRKQMMISGRPVSQTLQCPVHTWCLFLLKLTLNRREELVWPRREMEKNYVCDEYKNHWSKPFIFRYRDNSPKLERVFVRGAFARNYSKWKLIKISLCS